MAGVCLQALSNAGFNFKCKNQLVLNLVVKKNCI